MLADLYKFMKENKLFDYQLYLSFYEDNGKSIVRSIDISPVFANEEKYDPHLLTQALSECIIEKNLRKQLCIVYVVKETSVKTVKLFEENNFLDESILLETIKNCFSFVELETI